VFQPGFPDLDAGEADVIPIGLPEQKSSVAAVVKETNNCAPMNGAVGRERAEIQSSRKSEIVLPVAAKPRRE
jgi:hypothetical protein